MSEWQDKHATFVRESNRIEGITRAPTKAELRAHDDLWSIIDDMTLDAVMTFQSAIAPGKPIRDRVGMNVRVGNYTAPMGGRNIVIELMGLIGKINTPNQRMGNVYTPWKLHLRFERLHPFMDGNGRTGRALWAWHMMQIGDDPFAIPFLHRFYYQTLEAVP